MNTKKMIVVNTGTFKTPRTVMFCCGFGPYSRN